ncbi:MAG: hypothetical protein WCL08_03475, partial [Verrucomicrobiota bacterium]
MSTTPESEDFFRSRLDQMIDLRRPLPQLTLRMPVLPSDHFLIVAPSSLQTPSAMRLPPRKTISSGS